MSENDGGPVHPIPEVRAADGTGICEGWPGMSLRDWFAAKAMEKLIPNLKPGRDWDLVGAMSYEFADQMLAARAGLRKATP
jgi:hypothetical protein